MAEDDIKLKNLKKKRQQVNTKIAHLQDRKIDLIKEIKDIDEEIERLLYELGAMMDNYTDTL